MYERILVPLDGSEIAAAAVPVAARLPSRRVRLLRVEPTFQRLAPGGLENFRLDWREVRTEQIRDELAPLAAPFRAQGAEVEVVVRFGDPAEAIIAAAADADLTVMTTRGRGAAGRMLFGSTADRVARHGGTPTLLLRGGAEPVAAVAPRRLVVPLDGSPLAERALPVAVRLAQAWHLPLHLIRVVDLEEVMRRIREQRPELTDPVRDPAFAEARTVCEREAADYLAGHVEELRDRSLVVTTEVRTGSPAFVLLDQAKPDDLLVMTSHGHGGVRRWLIGSVAEKLVREAAAPVLLVPAAGRGREHEAPGHG